MSYDYFVRTVSGSSFDNLEGLGERLQNALGDEDALAQTAAGWELWQVQALSEVQGIHGLLLVYRRARS